MQNRMLSDWEWANEAAAIIGCLIEVEVPVKDCDCQRCEDLRSAQKFLDAWDKKEKEQGR